MSENYLGLMTRIISGNYDENYEWELSPSIKVSHGKVQIYRDTGVSKKYNYALKNLRTPN